MMIKEIDGNMVQVIILDISGIYAQIHNQGYFDSESVGKIKQQYSDTKHWRVLRSEERRVGKEC